MRRVQVEPNVMMSDANDEEEKSDGHDCWA
jgi:hypothetical protein